MESGSRAIRPLRQRDVQLYRVCDDLTEPVIYFMVLFSPWAFGTTQPWAIWTMNAAGYFLGVLLAVRLAVRWFKGYRPPRWGDQATGPQDHRAAAGSRRLVVSRF